VQVLVIGLQDTLIDFVLAVFLLVQGDVRVVEVFQVDSNNMDNLFQSSFHILVQMYVQLFLDRCTMFVRSFTFNKQINLKGIDFS
jgi:hypothetical protein